MINNTQHDCLEGLVDHVIWAGDFNYRVNMSRIDSELHSYKSHYRVYSTSNHLGASKS